MKKLLNLVFLFALLLQGASAQKIQKNMKINIAIFGVPPSEQSRVNNPQAPVDGNGNIRLWEVGTIRAAGLTGSQLGQKIEQAYKAAQIYTSPSVTVSFDTVETNLQQQVTVTGKVGRPGPIPFARGMTLAQAIATAGGPSTFGTTKRVNVYRQGKKYLLNPLENDKHKLERIYPDDTIEVDQVKAWESGGR